MTTYTPKTFEGLFGTKGLSDPLLRDHFSLYEGYVANSNKLIEHLRQMVNEEKTGAPEYAELKRRLGWEFNGMRLHEYYFGNMSKEGTAPDMGSNLIKKILNDFGSFELWEKEFKAIGALRGIGWVALYYDPEGERLFNVWINEHDVGHLFGTLPLLIMDVFEHAYMTDYGLKRTEYIAAFFKMIDWTSVTRRFEMRAKRGA